MTSEGPDPAEPDIDESGVDLAQVRAMLDRPPRERLAIATEFMNSLIAIRTRNAKDGTR